MIKGQCVCVFKEPLFREKPEGQAILLRRVNVPTEHINGREYERWYVRFKGSGFQVERNIEVN